MEPIAVLPPANDSTGLSSLQRKPCILVVEDEGLIRMMICDLLLELGAVVLEAETADEAWEILKARPDIDLLFSDNRMPGRLTGAELALKAKDLRSSICTVVGSGSADFTARADLVLQKPYDIVPLVEHLVALASGQLLADEP